MVCLNRHQVLIYPDEDVNIVVVRQNTQKNHSLPLLEKYTETNMITQKLTI